MQLWEALTEFTSNIPMNWIIGLYMDTLYRLLLKFLYNSNLILEHSYWSEYWHKIFHLLKNLVPNSRIEKIMVVLCLIHEWFVWSVIASFVIDYFTSLAGHGSFSWQQFVQPFHEHSDTLILTQINYESNMKTQIHFRNGPKLKFRVANQSEIICNSNNRKLLQPLHKSTTNWLQMCQNDHNFVICIPDWFTNYPKSTKTSLIHPWSSRIGYKFTMNP